MHDRLITDIGTSKYSLSVKRQGFTDKQLFKLYGKKVKKAKSPQMIKNRFCVHPLPENL